MIQQIKFTFQQRPAWQRYLILFATVIITAALLWIGLIFVFAFALLALAVSIVNKVKLKLTGRPLFKGPQHFHRYQSQFSQRNSQNGQSDRSRPAGNIIEGEVIREETKD